MNIRPTSLLTLANVEKRKKTTPQHLGLPQVFEKGC
jgi:hypothetical protein